MRFTLLLALTATPSIAALSQTPVPPAAEQITAAILPLPQSLRAGAKVLGFKTAGKLEVIRPGTNGMTCLALYVVQQQFHVACYHDGLEPFMARGRELREQGVTNPERIDSLRFAEIASGKLKMPSYGALYSLTAREKSAWNPTAGTATGARPLAVVYIPFATPENSGIPASAPPGNPWLMFPGTAKAHIMIVGTMQ